MCLDCILFLSFVWRNKVVIFWAEVKNGFVHWGRPLFLFKKQTERLKPLRIHNLRWDNSQKLFSSWPFQNYLNGKLFLLKLYLKQFFTCFTIKVEMLRFQFQASLSYINHRTWNGLPSMITSVRNALCGSAFMFPSIVSFIARFNCLLNTASLPRSLENINQIGFGFLRYARQNRSNSMITLMKCISSYPQACGRRNRKIWIQFNSR